MRRLCDSFASQVRVSTYRLIFSNSIELLFFSIMRLYAAVHFTVTNDTEAVPLTWLKSNENDTICYWPPYTSATKIMAAISTWSRLAGLQSSHHTKMWFVLFIIVYCVLLLLYLFIYFIFVLSLYECVVFSFSYSVLALLYVIFCTHAMVRL